MTTKLNLTVQKETASRAKVYAARKKTSVSKIVEDYLKELTGKAASKGKKSFVERTAGIIKDIRIDNIDEARDEYLKKKYGL
jgi:hypothetical protein